MVTVWPEPLEKLIAQLTRLPGIGPRTAQRLALHLARGRGEEARELAGLIGGLAEELRSCSRCGNLAGEELCRVCLDARRDGGLICVVEQPDNLAAIEATGAWRGVYHVLGGAIAPLREVGPEDLRIDELLERVGREDVREVILATNPTVEGEATAIYIARRLEGLVEQVTRPATGLPVGGELDYVDRNTLTRALEGRRRL